MDATLISAGLLAALGLASHAGSSGAVPAKSRSRQSRKKQVRDVRATGMAPRDRFDAKITPPSQLNVPRSSPRNIDGVIAWHACKVDSTITSSTTVITETNYTFLLTDHPQAASLAALYDQYCIFEVSITFDSGFPPGATQGPTRFYTALDFDNTTALASITSIEDFATCRAINMEPSTRFVRSIRPCNKGQVSGAATVVPQRTWVDCSSTAVPHYGIRTIAAISGTPNNINVTRYQVYAFRNQI